jgi:hypothetical protein
MSCEGIVNVRKYPRFIPRNLNDEMPPIEPCNVWLRNVTATNSGGGVNIEGVGHVAIDGLLTRNTPKPLVIKRAKRAYLHGLDFQE